MVPQIIILTNQAAINLFSIHFNVKRKHLKRKKDNKHTHTHTQNSEGLIKKLYHIMDWVTF